MLDSSEFSAFQSGDLRSAKQNYDIFSHLLVRKDAGLLRVQRPLRDNIS